MITTSLADVLRLTGARLVGTPAADAVTAAVEVDSRAVRPGGLYVALPGERTDGHDHAVAAVRAGAVAALVARPVEGVPCLVVPDPLAAMQALAHALYDAAGRPLTFGITGSSGKTSTKDLLATVLSAAGPTLSPPGSFNNEVGLPLTALRREPDTRFAVLEYSARGVGHIAFLRDIVRPDAATVLNIGSAHLGEFGSRANIALAKGELVEAGPAGGCSLAVLNADDPLVLGLAGRTSARVVTFGTGADADYRAEQIEVDDGGRARFVLATPSAGRADVQLRLRGEHQVGNALAVAANVLGTRVWDDASAVADLLSAAEPVSAWRMEVTERPDGVTVVNDAYNANPESMRAALKTLAVMSRGKTRRTIAVLGGMAELGDDAVEAHRDLGRFVVRLDISQLVVVGAAAGQIHAGAVLEGSWGGESVHVPDVDAAVALLASELAPGDVVLVKASRSAGLERVAAALLGPSLTGSGPMEPAL
ncbi:MAG: UDP-N-acetylmuramoyl-tripeptide--D-alanyl-D-alanine ligase [Frankiales bacterium]|nr:UDP-N-acetylmuramoyl-tripeptide--D-alanyl-D-alanine ligase [Frankiales bacterium]